MLALLQQSIFRPKIDEKSHVFWNLDFDMICEGFWEGFGRPKSSQNRGPKKHPIFRRFLLEKCFVAKVPTSKKHAPTQCFVKFLHIKAFRLLLAFWGPKTYQKASRNEVRTIQKLIHFLRSCAMWRSSLTLFTKYIIKRPTGT